MFLSSRISGNLVIVPLGSAGEDGCYEHTMVGREERGGGGGGCSLSQQQNKPWIMTGSTLGKHSSQVISGSDEPDLQSTAAAKPPSRGENRYFPPLRLPSRPLDTLGWGWGVDVKMARAQVQQQNLHPPPSSHRRFTSSWQLAGTHAAPSRTNTPLTSHERRFCALHS